MKRKIVSLFFMLALCFSISSTAFAANTFTDVSETDYYYDAVIWAKENGITGGVTATTFEPASTCTRGQVVTFLWRANGQPDPKTQTNPFKDISESNYFYKAVLWAVEKGITGGVTTDTFAPYQHCTRAHTLTFLWRAEGKPEVSGESIWANQYEGKYYYEALKWAEDNSMIRGSDLEFDPGNACPRADIVSYMYRALDGASAEKEIPPTSATGEPSEAPNEDPSETLESILSPTPNTGKYVSPEYSGLFIRFVETKGKLYEITDGGYYISFVQYEDGTVETYANDLQDLAKLIGLGTKNYTIESSDNPYLDGNLCADFYWDMKADVVHYGPSQYSSEREYLGPDRSRWHYSLSCNGKTITAHSDLAKEYEKNEVFNLNGIRCFSDGYSVKFSIPSVLEYLGLTFDVTHEIYKEEEYVWQSYPVLLKIH